MQERSGVGGTGGDGRQSRHSTQIAEQGREKGKEYLDKAKEETSDLVGRRNEYVEKAQEGAGQVVEKARDQLDTSKEKAVEGMERTAQTLRAKAGESGGVTAEVGTRVADGMEKTASYLRERTTAEIFDDFEGYVREHPLQAMAGAIFAGFMIGRIIR